jgi:hypothetical protein
MQRVSVNVSEGITGHSVFSLIVLERKVENGLCRNNPCRDSWFDKHFILMFTSKVDTVSIPSPLIADEMPLYFGISATAPNDHSQ